jgi:hypothetical protein
LVRILTRPTNHPRHAACASDDESKPVRPLLVERKISHRYQAVNPRHSRGWFQLIREIRPLRQNGGKSFQKMLFKPRQKVL